MSSIFRSRYFLVHAPASPLVDRADGGHIVVDPIMKIRDRQQLSPQQAIELMRLTMVVGEAMTRVMNRHGVDIGRINYQDNGNWSVFHPEGPQMHVHIYGRACYFPHRDEQPEFYKDVKPLTTEDINEFSKEIVAMLGKGKYSDAAWGLNYNNA